MYHYILLTFAILIGNLAIADTEKHHQETAFSASQVNASMMIIKESLDSFKKIVKTATDEEPIILNEYKHTNWEMLTIGIPNHLRTIKGALLKQQLTNAKLRYELCLEKKKNGSDKHKKITHLEKKYHDAQKKYERYIKNTQIID